jgi:hypothetical protein
MSLERVCASKMDVESSGRIKVFTRKQGRRKGGEAQEDEEEQHNSNTIATHGEAQEDEEEAVKYQRADTAHPSQKQCVITEAMFRQRSGDACKYT